MSRTAKLFTSVVVLSLCFASLAYAVGEDVLAQTGQYAFFINPCPPGGPTFYQKLVPCVVKETIHVPQGGGATYPVPVPSRQNVPTLVTEAPVGCPIGAEQSCATCYPKPSQQKGSREMWGPKTVPARVPSVQFTTREVTRRVMLPQWFAVTDEPRPVRKIQKVNTCR